MMSNNKLVVEWKSPELTPDVKKYDQELFWIAVRSKWSDSEPSRTSVYLAHYINKPLELDEDGEPLSDDCFVDTDGAYMDAVGWHDQYEHHDFSGFYQKVNFSEKLVLLGWAEYQPPEFTGVK